MSPSLNELTPIVSNMEIAHLGSDVSKFNYPLGQIKTNFTLIFPRLMYHIYFIKCITYWGNIRFSI